MPLIKVEETESWPVLIVLFSKGDLYTCDICLLSYGRYLTLGYTLPQLYLELQVCQQ